MNSIGLYLHIPFCRHRCAYCDFNTYAGIENIIPEYVQAICAEAEFVSACSVYPITVETIFFGGGTPSLLSVTYLEKILDQLHKQFQILPNVEVTLEVNPGTIDKAYLQEIYKLGVNRLSLGMQSANPDELNMLEREHDFLDVLNGVDWARGAGFDNLNLDLMFGLPGQKTGSWLKTLSLAIKLQPAHFSLYALTLEHGTPMQAWVARGLVSEPDSDLAADMYELADEMMGKHGYQQYEISNWARREADHRLMSCHHNLIYWRNLAYIGLGAGAHGYANKLRVANVLSPARYIKRLTNEKKQAINTARDWEFPKTPATVNITRVNKKTEMAETMLMGLRLTREGVSREKFKDRFGVGIEEAFASELEALIQQDLLEWQGDILRLTSTGRLLGNQVFMLFV